MSDMTRDLSRGRPGVMLRAHSHGKILETHFDDPTPYHTRQSYRRDFPETSRKG